MPSHLPTSMDSCPDMLRRSSRLQSSSPVLTNLRKQAKSHESTTRVPYPCYHAGFVVSERKDNKSAGHTIAHLQRPEHALQ